MSDHREAMMRRDVSLIRGVAITRSHMAHKPFKTTLELFQNAHEFNRRHPVGSTVWVKMDHEPCYRPRTVLKAAKFSWNCAGYPVFEVYVSYRYICNFVQCHSSRMNVSINNVREDA